jgi:hypothetical protein
MTRLCIQCDRIIGERCAHYGTEATPLKANSNGHAVYGTEFNCPSCGHRFPQGEGGKSGGICEPCFYGVFLMACKQAKKIGEMRFHEHSPEESSN